MIRVVLIDDHELVRTGFRMILAQQTGIEIAGEAADGETGLAMIRSESPDVAIVDVHMPRLSGIELTDRVRKHKLATRIVILTVVSEAPSDSKRAFFGAWVTLEDEDGEEVTYRIVGPDESNVEKGWISMDAPVAKALMGKRDGDEVTVKRPKGDITYTIAGIRYTEA